MVITARALVLLALAACSSGSISPVPVAGSSIRDGGTSPIGDQADAGDSGRRCLSSASQGLSGPCCPELGIDACGANLFCAAFDGREQATCYPERSRMDGTECTA